MNVTAYAHADAHESVTVRAALVDRHASVLEVDRQTALYVHGNDAQRADFLRRLAAELTAAADEISPRVEVDGIPELVVPNA